MDEVKEVRVGGTAEANERTLPSAGALAEAEAREGPPMSVLRRLAHAHWRTALGAALGAAGGAAYAHFVGCRTGTCPLTSNVWTAGMFFGLAGGLVGWPGPARRAGQAPPGQDAREVR